MVVLEDCPFCRGAGLLSHEGGWCTYVTCMDCGAHTVYAEYSTDEEKHQAEETVVRLWNMGKVNSLAPGE